MKCMKTFSLWKESSRRITNNNFTKRQKKIQNNKISNTAVFEDITELIEKFHILTVREKSKGFFFKISLKAFFRRISIYTDNEWKT